MKKTRILVFMSLLIALNVILTRIVRPIETDIVRVSFGFIAISLSSVVLGPWLSGLAATVADVVGYFLFPSITGFYPGFTASAFLSGILYGLFLYKKELSLIRVILSVTAVTIFVDLGLNTLWLSLMRGNPFLIVLLPRIIKSAILLPIQIVLIFTTWKYVGKYIEKSYL